MPLFPLSIVYTLLCNLQLYEAACYISSSDISLSDTQYNRRLWQADGKTSVHNVARAKPCYRRLNDEILIDSRQQLGARTCPRMRTLHYHVQASHQTSHFLLGFMRVPGAQENCSANSLELDSGPWTRNIGRLCESPIIDIRLSSGRLFVHHTYKIR